MRLSKHRDRCTSCLQLGGTDVHNLHNLQRNIPGPQYRQGLAELALHMVRSGIALMNEPNALQRGESGADQRAVEVVNVLYLVWVAKTAFDHKLFDRQCLQLVEESQTLSVSRIYPLQGKFLNVP